MVVFKSNLSGMNSTKWDVSVAQDESIMAWYTTNAAGAHTVYIGSEDEIIANPNSSYLCANIGSSTKCKSTTAVKDIGLLNTKNVTNMSYMFYNCGANAMTALELKGDKFDTSRVTNMSYMFKLCGKTAMTSLNLENKLNTSNVTNMIEMFSYC